MDNLHFFKQILNHARRACAGMDGGNHTERLGDRERGGGGGGDEVADGVARKRERRNKKYISTKSWKRFEQE